MINMILYILAFFVIIIISKFVFKKKLNYQKIIIIGFFTGIIINLILFLLAIIFKPDSYLLNIYLQYPATLAGSLIAESFISLIIFVILYSIGRIMYKPKPQ